MTFVVLVNRCIWSNTVRTCTFGKSLKDNEDHISGLRTGMSEKNMMRPEGNVGGCTGQGMVEPRRRVRRDEPYRKFWDKGVVSEL